MILSLAQLKVRPDARWVSEDEAWTVSACLGMWATSCAVVDRRHQVLQAVEICNIVPVSTFRTNELAAEESSQAVSASKDITASSGSPGTPRRVAPTATIINQRGCRRGFRLEAIGGGKSRSMTGTTVILNAQMAAMSTFCGTRPGIHVSTEILRRGRAERATPEQMIFGLQTPARRTEHPTPHCDTPASPATRPATHSDPSASRHRSTRSHVQVVGVACEGGP